jgi:preprotein translocase subunit SecG
MMWILYTLFVILCFLLIGLILIQRSKSSLGVSGAFGSGAQSFFGGSGGQDFFQKTTWWFIACFMGGSLGLALLKYRSVNLSRYRDAVRQELLAETAQSAPAVEQPATPAEVTATPPAAAEQPQPAQPTA